MGRGAHRTGAGYPGPRRPLLGPLFYCIFLDLGMVTLVSHYMGHIPGLVGWAGEGARYPGQFFEVDLFGISVKN